MRKITPIIFVFVLLINLSFLTAISYPHAFHGTITIEDEQKNPEGQILIGKIDGIATGSCIISDGKYDLVITDNIGNEGKIEFYICNEKAEEISEFITFEVTELNLTFNTIPLDLCDCGNSICEAGECSSCPIDCGISECLGNGICDLEMGEDCNTAPVDCACTSGYSCKNGVCKKDESNNDNNDDSPGGKSPLGNSPIQQDSITNDSDNQNDILSIKSLNEADKQKETGPGITGGVIGFLKSGGGLVAMIFVILIIVIGIGVIILKRKTSKNEK